MKPWSHGMMVISSEIQRFIVRGMWSITAAIIGWNRIFHRRITGSIPVEIRSCGISLRKWERKRSWRSWSWKVWSVEIRSRRKLTRNWPIRICILLWTICGALCLWPDTWHSVESRMETVIIWLFPTVKSVKSWSVRCWSCFRKAWSRMAEW